MIMLNNTARNMRNMLVKELNNLAGKGIPIREIKLSAGDFYILIKDTKIDSSDSFDLSCRHGLVKIIKDK